MGAVLEGLAHCLREQTFFIEVRQEQKGTWNCRRAGQTQLCAAPSLSRSLPPEEGRRAECQRRRQFRLCVNGTIGNVLCCWLLLLDV